MECYIYPAGGHGRTLGSMINFLDSSMKVNFIDDAYDEISLDKQAKVIKESGSEVLLALEKRNPNSKNILQHLKNNLDSCGIKNYKNKMLWYSTCVVEKCKRKIEENQWNTKDIIGVGVYNLGGEKHLGYVDAELKKNGFKILYLCSNDISYQKYSQKDGDDSYAIPLPIEYFDLVDFIWGLYMTTPLLNRNPKVKYFYQPHGIADMAEGILRFGGVEEMMEIMRFPDFIFTTTKREFEILTQVFSDYHLHSNIIKAGYPAFEITLKEYQETQDEVKDSVLVAMPNESDLPDIQEGIELLLKNGIKVIFRPGFGWKKRVVDEFISLYSGWLNFSVDVGERISTQSYLKSFAVVISASSVGYTFPMTTLCPAILFFKNESIINRNYCGFGYFDSRLHLYAKDAKGLLENALKIQKNYKNYQKKILEYRENEVYHFNQSSSFIAQTLKEIWSKER